MKTRLRNRFRLPALATGLRLDIGCSGDGVNLYARRDGNAEFVFLARDTAVPYVDNRPLLTAGKDGVRRHKATCALDNAEIGLLSNEVTVPCWS